jgi:hypothetical protein
MSESQHWYSLDGKPVYTQDTKKGAKNPTRPTNMKRRTRPEPPALSKRDNGCYCKLRARRLHDAGSGQSCLRSPCHWW